MTLFLIVLYPRDLYLILRSHLKGQTILNEDEDNDNLIYLGSIVVCMYVYYYVSLIFNGLSTKLIIIRKCSQKLAISSNLACNLNQIISQFHFLNSNQGYSTQLPLAIEYHQRTETCISCLTTLPNDTFSVELPRVMCSIHGQSLVTTTHLT